MRKINFLILFLFCFPLLAWSETPSSNSYQLIDSKIELLKDKPAVSTSNKYRLEDLGKTEMVRGIEVLYLSSKTQTEDVFLKSLQNFLQDEMVISTINIKRLPDPEVKKIMEQYQLKTLPAVIFSQEVESLFNVVPKYTSKKLMIPLKNRSYLLSPSTVSVESDLSRPYVTGDIKLFVMSQCPYGRQAQDLIAQTFAPAEKQKVKAYYMFKKNQKGQLEASHGPEELKEDLFQACLQEEHTGLYWEYLTVELRSLGKNGKSDQLKLKGISSQKPYQTCQKRTMAEHLKQKYVTESLEYQNQYQISSSPTFLMDNQNFYSGMSPEVLNLPIFKTTKVKKYLELKQKDNPKSLSGACGQ